MIGYSTVLPLRKKLQSFEKGVNMERDIQKGKAR